MARSFPVLVLAVASAMLVLLSVGNVACQLDRDWAEYMAAHAERDDDGTVVTAQIVRDGEVIKSQTFTFNRVVTSDSVEDELKDAVSDYSERVDDALSDAASQLASADEQMSDAVEEALSQASSQIAEAIDDISEHAEEDFSELIDAMSDMLSDLVD